MGPRSTASPRDDESRQTSVGNQARRTEIGKDHFACHNFSVCPKRFLWNQMARNSRLHKFAVLNLFFFEETK